MHRKEVALAKLIKNLQLFQLCALRITDEKENELVLILGKECRISFIFPDSSSPHSS